MAIDSDIRDQAYQFFIHEAPELLHAIETDLLTLREERSTAKVHNMMRAAHSLKGGAASVGLETIKTLAHSLEDIFKALFNEELEIDTEIESLLLQGYDCLRLPLIEQITIGHFNSAQAMTQAEPVFAQIEARLGDFLGGSAELPSSVELGVDIALSIFEVDIAQGLESLANVLAAPQGKEVAGELRAQAEVFSGIAELLNLPGFGAIAQTTLAALDAHPDQALEITQLALADFQAAQQAVIAGDRTTGGAPSAALAKLANLTDAITAPEHTSEVELVDTEDTASFSLDNVFGDFDLTAETVQPVDSSLFKTVDENSQELVEQIFNAELVEQTHTSPVGEEVSAIPSLDDIFGDVEHSASPVAEEEVSAIPSLDDVFGDFAVTAEPAALDPSPQTPVTPITVPPQKLLPEIAAVNAQDVTREIVPPPPALPTPQLSVRVDLERLEAMNNLVGELSINRNSLSLQSKQLQGTVQEVLRRFAKFQQMGRRLRNLSDRMLVAPERYNSWMPRTTGRIRGLRSINDVGLTASGGGSFAQADFDSLEMDTYGELHSVLQGTLEEIVLLEETVGDVVLLAGQSTQTIEAQRQILGLLRDNLMWARMLPLDDVLNRFPRMMRDLSTSYNKPVNLKMSGTGVLIDKAALEKLSDPLLHLLRNAFDHGIETPEVRRQQGKPERGQIEIRAYHQGSQTIIEVRDDGRGMNLERIKSRALDMGLLSPEQLATASTSRLLELVFQPGFSTASQVSELSGRGVGLDVVRSQLRSLKGNVTVTSEPGQGTSFTLRIPLTLSIAKLLVCFVGSNAFALPSDSIEEILIPQPEQVKHSGGQRFLHWQNQIVPVRHLSDLLIYGCPLPQVIPSQALEVAPSPEDWASPMLLLSQDDQILALEIDRLVTEQELVIKPFGGVIAPPSYIYGCTILGDGSLIPVIDGAALLNSLIGPSKTATFSATLSGTPTSTLKEDSSTSSIAAPPLQTVKTPTILVIDDSITLRQTLALTFEKAGYRVWQARDGREGIEQLQQNSSIIQLAVCDIEMPNMNGFEFLSQRRTDPLLAKIPTVMLTSRSSDKHQQLAMHLGANGYFTKPYIEQEFLAALAALINQDASVGVPALAR